MNGSTFWACLPAFGSKAMLRKWSMLAGFAALLTAAPAMALGVAPSAAKADDNNANGIVYPASAPLAIAAPQTDVGPGALPSPSNCNIAGCTLRFTGAQLVAAAEAAIAQRDFANAAPLVEALGQAPDYKFQHRFLKGFIAAETGDIAAAETAFRKILADDPKQTRVRLELARIMLMKGQEGAANYHFRLAQQDKDLPEEIRQTVSSIRSIIRSKRKWNLNFDFGIAPDTNINSATAAETVNINFGPTQVPLTLNDDARKKSGIGQTAGLSAGLRLKASEALAFIIYTDFRGVNYEGKSVDNFQLQLGAGPELRLSPSSSLSVQAIGEQRWYGG
ncbi:MAG: hypothetical protein KAZ17_03200, partial [Sphingorhabdus sp.]|nr:hypothetical protein [Sphingorhabdus sp.]